MKITNSYKFESSITVLSNGKTVNKLKDYRFQIGDYLIYNKEKEFYYNKLCTNKKFVLEFRFNSGYVAHDEINHNNGNNDKTSMIDLSRSN